MYVSAWSVAPWCYPMLDCSSTVEATQSDGAGALSALFAGDFSVSSASWSLPVPRSRVEAHQRQVTSASEQLAAPVFCSCHATITSPSMRAIHVPQSIVTDIDNVSRCRRRRQDLSLDPAMQVFVSRESLAGGDSGYAAAIACPQSLTLANLL